MVATRNSLNESERQGEEHGPLSADAIASQISKRIVIVPGEPSIQQLSVVMLKHPRTGSPMPFMVSGLDGRVFEVLQYSEDNRSWFIDDFVVEDGSLYLATPFHHLFLALPYLLSAAKNFEPWDQLIVDNECPATSSLLSQDNVAGNVGAVCDTKDVGDVRVYRLNKEKLLSWLHRRHDRLMEALKETASSQRASLIKDPDLLARYAFGILCDYLPPSFDEVLKEHLCIKDIVELQQSEQPPPAKKAKSSSAVDNGPVEDYYDKKLVQELKKSASEASGAKATSAQKQLRKASTGTKSLMTFFNKK